MRSDDYALMDEGNYLYREIVPCNCTNNTGLFRVFGRGVYHFLYGDWASVLRPISTTYFITFFKL